MSPWARWVAYVERPVDARPLAMVRILLGLAILGDQLRMAWLGMVPLLYRNGAFGGLAMPAGGWYVMDDLLGGVWGGIVTWMLLVLCAGAMVIGWQARAAMLGVIVFYAQLFHGFHWDNGGDRIARTALLILLFSGATSTLTWRDTARRTTAAWSADLLRWLLFLVYFDAGLAKLFPRPWNWLSDSTPSVTYRIMVYPLTSDLDAGFWWDWPLTLYALDVMTIVVEMSAFLIFTRLRCYWALVAAPIHVGIWWGMTIDHFAFVMLAMYPMLFDRWLVAALDRITPPR